MPVTAWDFLRFVPSHFEVPQVSVQRISLMPQGCLLPVSSGTADYLNDLSILRQSPLVQVGLLDTVKDMVFEPTVEVLYGAALVAAVDMARLQQAFFGFEAGFELAASPVPHLLQRSFCAARRHLLTVFRQARSPLYTRYLRRLP